MSWNKYFQGKGRFYRDYGRKIVPKIDDSVGGLERKTERGPLYRDLARKILNAERNAIFALTSEK